MTLSGPNWLFKDAVKQSLTPGLKHMYQATGWIEPCTHIMYRVIIGFACNLANQPLDVEITLQI